MEVEWGHYTDTFVGMAAELCGRTSGKGDTPRSRNQGWMDGRCGEGSGGEAGSMEDDIRL